MLQGAVLRNIQCQQVHGLQLGMHVMCAYVGMRHNPGDLPGAVQSDSDVQVTAYAFLLLT